MDVIDFNIIVYNSFHSDTFKEAGSKGQCSLYLSAIRSPKLLDYAVNHFLIPARIVMRSYFPDSYIWLLWENR